MSSSGTVTEAVPEAERPPLPDFFPEYEAQDGEWRFNRGKAQFQCNWVRAIENGVDRTHAVFVHTDFGNPERTVAAPYEVVDEDQGLLRPHFGAIRKGGVYSGGSAALNDRRVTRAS